MHTGWFCRLAVALTVAAPLRALAEPAEQPLALGGWFGPRIFSGSSLLGYIDNAPCHPTLESSIELGARAGHSLFAPWLVPEFELAISPTSTTAICGADAAKIFWFEPRVQLRFDLARGRRFQPFVVIGGGSPVVLSSARKTFDAGIVGDGYAGGGVRLDTQRGFVLRLDARVALVPGRPHTSVVVPEVDVGFGVEIVFGVKRPPTQEQLDRVAKARDALKDSDGDGIPDIKDQCPERAEDFDGFEDADGCPDIDNDRDGVLDIADKCPNVPETYNGFEDEDGCPDSVPADVAALHGTIEGLLYAEGETAVHDSARPSLRKIAKVLKDHPGVRVVLIGHADAREAKAFATAPAPNEPPPDLEQLANDLSRARAEAVRQALVAEGIPATRVDVDGTGAEEPVADNATPRGRLANRRVAIRLFIAPH